ncbi:hypothetical protein CISG_04648 [Coccidioides immitis RMSCC 3703]|uniref:Uncharacterized protein n=1 Tax=Coccidioides immitis RMSCC 3703 TaxID=454286 RepID=A0A0J8QP67_COCIT|nr:hypothetical protein CISG_04648 [Coccidioides immitis RMSCC 3703]
MGRRGSLPLLKQPRSHPPCREDLPIGCPCTLPLYVVVGRNCLLKSTIKRHYWVIPEDSNTCRTIILIGVVVRAIRFRRFTMEQGSMQGQVTTTGAFGSVHC